jgi:hypothetical protein
VLAGRGGGGGGGRGGGGRGRRRSPRASTPASPRFIVIGDTPRGEGAAGLLGITENIDLSLYVGMRARECVCVCVCVCVLGTIPYNGLRANDLHLEMQVLHHEMAQAGATEMPLGVSLAEGQYV